MAVTPGNDQSEVPIPPPPYFFFFLCTSKLEDGGMEWVGFRHHASASNRTDGSSVSVLPRGDWSRRRTCNNINMSPAQPGSIWGSQAAAHFYIKLYEKSHHVFRRGAAKSLLLVGNNAHSWPRARQGTRIRGRKKQRGRERARGRGGTLPCFHHYNHHPKY